MPYAYADIKGNFLAPNLEGRAEFYPWLDGSIVKVEVANLPLVKEDMPLSFFGFHIHEGDNCDNHNTKFEGTKGHYNPTSKNHPFHAGDLPVLLSNDGYAYMTVYTNRFKPEDIVNKTVIIHINPDDYRTQPSGSSGDRIACGIINKI